MRNVVDSDAVEAYRQGLGPKLAARLTEAQLAEQAMTVAARIDGEIERMQRAGELKTVNKTYRDYRLETAARGEKITPYRAWMRVYRNKLVCEFAATLRAL